MIWKKYYMLLFIVIGLICSNLPMAEGSYLIKFECKGKHVSNEHLGYFFEFEVTPKDFMVSHWLYLLHNNNEVEWSEIILGGYGLSSDHLYSNPNLKKYQRYELIQDESKGLHLLLPKNIQEQPEKFSGYLVEKPG